MSVVPVRYFTPAEANALLPALSDWLSEVWQLDRLLTPLANDRGPLLTRAESHNVGGPALEVWLTVSLRWTSVLLSIHRTGALVKDLGLGLIDFRHRLDNGREVLLCWQHGEPEVAYYHDLDAGFAGRRPLSELR